MDRALATVDAVILLRNLPRDENCTLNDPDCVEACADIPGTQCYIIQRMIDHLMDKLY